MPCVLIRLISGRTRTSRWSRCIQILTLWPRVRFGIRLWHRLSSRSLPRWGEDPDRKLCPVRALLHYRKVTSNPDLRKGRRRLFVSYKLAKTDEIKRATISSWLAKLIKLAYESERSNPQILQLTKVSAHEVRALSASWSVFRCVPMGAIVGACTWRAKSTFSDFYLRDMCAFLDDMFVLKPSVMGLCVSVIHARTTTYRIN